MKLLLIIPLLNAFILSAFCQDLDESDEIGSITKVIIAEGEARQNNDF